VEGARAEMGEEEGVWGREREVGRGGEGGGRREGSGGGEGGGR